MICGVGINDADYNVTKELNGKRIWTCPFYKEWSNMIMRSCNPKVHNRQPTYKDCKVCDEWLYFMTFKAWMGKQNWKGLHLDKDILFKGNKMYSPETCVFVGRGTNNILNDHKCDRGKYLLGVHWNKGAKKFHAQCRDGSGKIKYLGLFNNELEGHHEYLKFKITVIERVAKRQMDIRVEKSLIATSQAMRNALINITIYS